MRRGVFFLWTVSAAFVMIFSGLTQASEEATYEAAGKRDPFLPLVSMSSSEAGGLLGVESLEDIVVEGVVYDPSAGSIAILNGSVLRDGEEIGSVTVLKVRPDGVEVSVSGVSGFKPLFQEEAKGKKSA